MTHRIDVADDSTKIYLSLVVHLGSSEKDSDDDEKRFSRDLRRKIHECQSLPESPLHESVKKWIN